MGAEQREYCVCARYRTTVIVLVVGVFLLIYGVWQYATTHDSWDSLPGGRSQPQSAAAFIVVVGGAMAFFAGWIIVRQRRRHEVMFGIRGDGVLLGPGGADDQNPKTQLLPWSTVSAIEFIDQNSKSRKARYREIRVCLTQSNGAVAPTRRMGEWQADPAATAAVVRRFAPWVVVRANDASV